MLVTPVLPQRGKVVLEAEIGLSLIQDIQLFQVSAGQYLDAVGGRPGARCLEGSQVIEPGVIYMESKTRWQ
jgi:hypothetical protein